MRIDAEHLRYTGRQAAPAARLTVGAAVPQPGELLAVERGVNGTAPAAHAAGATVVLLDAVPPCVGDCNSDGAVAVNELLTMVNVALGNAQIGSCPLGDANGDAQVTINEILAAVNNALSGCS